MDATHVFEMNAPERQRLPPPSQSDLDEERAEGEGMGTARVLSSTERKDSKDDGASLLVTLRRRIEKHPYASMLVAAAIGAGLGSDESALESSHTVIRKLQSGKYRARPANEKPKAPIVGTSARSQQPHYTDENDLYLLYNSLRSSPILHRFLG